MAVNVGELLFKIGADIATFKADMGKVESEFSKAMKKMDNTSQKLGQALAFAFSAAGVVAFVNQTKKLAALGDELNDVSEAFKALGGNAASIQAAKEATQGLVSELDLMKAANKGLIAGIPELNKNFAAIADVATRVAESTGGDAKEAIDSLLNAIIKGSPLALAKFGIFIEKGAKAEEVFRKLGEAQKALPPIATGVAGGFEKVGVALSEAAAQFGRLVEDSPQLKSALDNIATAINGIADALEWLNHQLGRSTEAKLEKLISLREGKLKGNLTALSLPEMFSGVKPETIAMLNKGIELLEAQQKKLAEMAGTPPLRPDKDGRSLAKEIEAANRAWIDFRDELKRDEAERLIDFGLDAEDIETWEAGIKDLILSLNIEFDKLLTEFKKKGVTVSDDLAEETRKAFLQKYLSPHFKEREKFETDAAIKAAEEMQKAHEKAAEEAQRAYEETFQSLATTFADLMSEALETGTIDFERIMQRIAIDFASTVAAGLAASVLGNLPGGSIGQVIGGGLLQSLGVGGSSVLGNLLGAGAAAGGAGLIGSLGGGAGVLLSTGEIIGAGAAIPAGASAVGSAALPGTGALGMLGAMGPWGWAALGALAIGGGLFAGGVFGGGGMSAGQRERANIREQIAQQAGNEGLFSTPWGMRDLFDIDFADFKPGASAIGDAAFGQMSGLAAILTGGGEQMDEFQSILAQMATGWSDSATQAENLNQVLIAQMSLMSQMGISAEEAKQSLLDLFFQGKISLEEFSAGVEQMNLIATENLIGEGSIADALGLLADTINTDPRSALHALMLAFKEAAEVSDDQLGAVREVFVQMFGPEAAAILDAFAQMGIDTWEELANASVDQIVFIFGQLQQIATDTVEAVSDAAQSTAETVGRGVTLNVDARGAGPGVGEEVRAAVMSMRGEIEQISAHATSQMLARQASFGGAL